MIIRATYLTEQGAYNKALSDCSEALRLDPKCVQAYALRAQLWSQAEEVEEDEVEKEVEDVDTQGVLMKAAKDALAGE
jgi:Tfp pilus assembly protein PilF